MAFREKVTWLTLLGLMVAYGAYFAVLGPRVAFGENSLTDIIWSFGPVAVFHAVVTIVGSIAIAAMAPRDAQRPADERERAITMRSNSIGFYFVLSGLILVGIVMPFSEPPFKIINVALGILVIAEIVRYGAAIVSYRRGWSG